MDSESIIAIVIGASLVTLIVLIVFILSKFNFLIKKELIQKGEAYQLPKNRFKYLELGCIILGLGVGLGFSSIFTAMDLSEDAMDLLIWATILIFGGTGLVGAHFIRRKQEGE
ncbi:hypothetical protein GCM10011506_22930 [Marivirga lumbricoides]|uniref:Uncharacterized protein n=1 Tax=Marivirga lumbricoides TaxID=1046115 RepID=A0A2T4DRM0_9BACT|nr:hypothetical protein C9994_07215 [Marivirga lumbricoides]GGC36926.1 hypothetical protein GCM10011506_22930 [Marivirga lumbricoides]